MYFCYVDESGDSGTLHAENETDTPIYVAVGLIVSQSSLYSLTHKFLDIKRRFYRSGMDVKYPLNDILYEVKGESIRKFVRKGNRRNVTHAIGYIDAIVTLLKNNSAYLLAKCLVKGIGVENSDAGFYSSALQHIWTHFQHFLAQQSCRGIVIADSRRQAQNAKVAHAIFTQYFGFSHERYPNLMELPTYAHSQNHAMIQITDIVCSSILFPMMVNTYWQDLANVHVSQKFAIIHGRYKEAIKNMQYRYFADNWLGGILVTDGTNGRRTASHLFA